MSSRTNLSRPACAGCVDGLAAAGAAGAAGVAPDSAIGRRTFLVQSAILAAAAALAACGGSGATSPNISTGTQIDLSSYPSLDSVGGVAMVTVGGAPLAVVRTDTSTYLVLSRVCPHQGGIVNQVGSDFQCPVHGATFTLTGQWIGGQRTSNLHSYPATYDAASNTLTIS